METEILSYGCNALLALGAVGGIGIYLKKYKPQIESVTTDITYTLNAIARVNSLFTTLSKSLEAKEGEAEGVITPQEQTAIISEIRGLVEDPNIKYLMNKYKV